MTPRAAFLRGAGHSLPFIIIMVPFSMLFGVVAAEAGLPLAETLAFSVMVVAGASQFTALQLMQDGASVFMVLAASLAVNLRLAMYSAALVPYLGAAPLWQRVLIAYCNVDQTYTLAQVEYARRDHPLPARVAYFIGSATPLFLTWFVFTWVGAAVGAQIPDAFALDFAVPIAFLAMVAPALRTAAHKAAAVTSVAVALAFAWLPSGLGVIVAGLAAMAVGAQVELWLERHGKWR